ncbi:patatin-like phospholipase family protein [Amaricoccus sp.]|uniref:patatin-like phospholipase family protein n=1 Tax=Amaricoccus sp. TaxID=1872485 RepID=UPI001B6702AC|nr:patatin-like phospholipase family protein [Amaricoccus sp.]MBP7240759.1 patatin-like phospholipase family protein [Amaricoccus sp.]
MAVTAFVLAGGGSLGAVQVGMLMALTAAGVRPDFVIGSSVGALNAAYFTGAPDQAGVERLAEIWCGLRRSDVFPFSLTRVLGVLRRSSSIVDPAPLRRLLETRIPFARIEDARLPLHVMATDQQGLAVRLSSGPVIEAILASAAVPGIFPPVTIGARQLMDGAIAANTPLHMAVGLGATRIIVLPTGYACTLTTPPQGAIARVLHAVTLLIAWQLMHEIETMPAGATAHLAPTLCPLAVSPYDFTAAHRLVARAHSGTAAWIAAGGLTRPSRASELAAHHHH